MIMYVYGMNWNPIKQTEENYLTEVKIPAENDEEAKAKLKALIGEKVASKCCLNDIYPY